MTMDAEDIVIVDDNPDNLRILAAMLQNAGYLVRPVREPASLFAVLDAKTPNLILLDIMMPGMNGFEVCEQLKKNPSTRNIPVIFVSARDEVSDKWKAFEAGGVDYITKPFQDLEVLARVKTHIRLHRLQEHLADEVQKGIKRHQEQQALIIQQTKMAALGEMIGAIAHQWKQPLNSIQVVATNILDSYEYRDMTAESLKSDCGEIMKNVAFMNETITDFIDFFKPDKEKKATSVLLSLQRVLNILRKRISVHGITVVQPETDAEIFGAPTELQQVLLNIINNAIDELVGRRIPNPWIRIEIERLKSAQDPAAGLSEGASRPSVLVRILDNAGGVSGDLIERIFESFYTTKGEKGSGIGLYISRLIVEKSLEGTLTAKNEKEGLAFSILLPLNIPGNSLHNSVVEKM